MVRRPRALALLGLVAALGSAAAQGSPDALKLFRAGRYDDARAACLAEIESNPANVESYVVLSWSLLSLERWADAELYARKGYDEVRKDARLVESLGEACYHLGKNEDSLRYFQAYVNALPEGDRIGPVYYFMGEVYIRMGRYAHADIAIRSALQYFPRNARWTTRLAYAEEKAGDYEYALASYEAALAINPDLKDAVLGRDRMRAALGD